MLAKLLLIFIVVTLAEMLVLLRVGAILQLGPTLALIVLTGLIGASLAKRQGLRILTRINAEMEAGRLPTAELADGALVLLCGPFPEAHPNEELWQLRREDRPA